LWLCLQVRDLITRANSAEGQLQLLVAQSDKDDKDVEPEPTRVEQDAICTFQGVFDALEAEGFGVKLNRCLLCKDGAPEPEEMDEVVAAVRSAGDKAAIVFSCSSGVERTQVGMTLASLMFAIDQGAKPRGYVDPPEGPEVPDVKDKAQYAGIVELCQSLPEGQLCKAVVDDVIDDNETMFNLRKIVAQAAAVETVRSIMHRRTWGVAWHVTWGVLTGCRARDEVAGGVPGHGPSRTVLVLRMLRCIPQASGQRQIPAELQHLATIEAWNQAQPSQTLSRLS